MHYHSTRQVRCRAIRIRCLRHSVCAGPCKFVGSRRGFLSFIFLFFYRRWGGPESLGMSGLSSGIEIFIRLWRSYYVNVGYRMSCRRLGGDAA